MIRFFKTYMGIFKVPIFWGVVIFFFLTAILGNASGPLILLFIKSVALAMIMAFLAVVMKFLEQKYGKGNNFLEQKYGRTGNKNKK